MRYSDSRVSLQPNTVLQVSNYEQGTVTYSIVKEIGRGSSCIVYDGFYLNNEGTKRPVRMKECYPLGLDLKRGQDSGLISRDEAAFQEEKERFRQGFRLNNLFSDVEELTNTAANTIDLYEANGTVYTVTAYVEGTGLCFDEKRSLKSVLTIARTLARAIGNIHRRGYLYLDLKPSNVFLYRETEELVQLFDFDSPVSMRDLKRCIETNTRIPVLGTRGFSASELQQGLLRQIGPATDVYALGALVFYLLFGKMPSASDCDEDATYCFADSIFDQDEYSDQLPILLTDFFHQSLASYYLDRYRDMVEAEEALNQILEEAGAAGVFLHSSKVSAPKQMVGRKEELSWISRWWSDPNEPVLYLSGMGGIGKSTLVRQFAADHREKIRNLLYLSVQGDLCNLVSDDLQVAVHGVRKLEEESEQDYFERKVEALKRLGTKDSSLLILDNFSGELTENHQLLLHMGWKTILISREARYEEFFPSVKLGVLSGEKECRELFEGCLGRELLDTEQDDFSYLCHLVQGHTLVLELLGRQIGTSALSLKEACQLAKSQGFSDISGERIDFARDQHFQYDSIRGIIQGLFDRQSLSVKKHGILKNMTLFFQSGVSMQFLRTVLGLPDDQLFYELEEEGWIWIRDSILSMHPLIYEVSVDWKWQREEIAAAEAIMDGIRENLEDQKLETDKRRSLLYCTEQICDAVVRRGDFKTSQIFYRFMVEAVGQMPPDREDMILKYGELLLGGWSRKSSACSRKKWMKVCDMVNTVYLNRQEYSASERVLKLAKKIAGREQGLMAFYYSMLGQYYDYRLQGEYDDAYGNPLLDKLLDNQRKIVSCWKRVKGKEARREQLAAMAELAIMLIRSVPEEKERIQKLLLELKEEMKHLEETNTEAEYACHMALAWYYTYVDCQPARMDLCVKKGKRVAKHVYLSDLDQIDYVWMPYANMKLESKGADSGQLEEALELLKTAVNLCDQYPDIAVYQRKKAELVDHMETVLAV